MLFRLFIVLAFLIVTQEATTQSPSPTTMKPIIINDDNHIHSAAQQLEGPIRETGERETDHTVLEGDRNCLKSPGWCLYFSTR